MSLRRSDRLWKKPKDQKQSEKPNVSILVDSPEHKPHIPYQDDIPPSSPKELSKKEDRGEKLELQNPHEQL